MTFDFVNGEQFGNSSSSQVSCWVLVAEGTLHNVQYHISVQIDDYDLENSTECADDRLQVRNGVWKQTILSFRLLCSLVC